MSLEQPPKPNKEKLGLEDLAKLVKQSGGDLQEKQTASLEHIKNIMIGELDGRAGRLSVGQETQEDQDLQITDEDLQIEVQRVYASLPGQIVKQVKTIPNFDQKLADYLGLLITQGMSPDEARKWAVAEAKYFNSVPKDAQQSKPDKPLSRSFKPPEQSTADLLAQAKKDGLIGGATQAVHKARQAQYEEFRGAQERGGVIANPITGQQNEVPTDVDTNTPGKRAVANRVAKIVARLARTPEAGQGAGVAGEVQQHIGLRTGNERGFAGPSSDLHVVEQQLEIVQQAHEDIQERLTALKSHPDPKMREQYREMLEFAWSVEEQEILLSNHHNNLKNKAHYSEKAREIWQNLENGDCSLLEITYKPLQWAYNKGMETRKDYDAWISNQQLDNEKNNRGAKRWLKRQTLRVAANAGSVVATGVALPFILGGILGALGWGLWKWGQAALEDKTWDNMKKWLG